MIALLLSFLFCCGFWFFSTRFLVWFASDVLRLPFSFHIKKGRKTAFIHYSFSWGRKKLSKECIFDESAKNTIGINRLFGYTYGIKNSACFGFRYCNNAIEILALVKRNGKLVDELEEHVFVGKVPLNESFTYTIELTKRTLIKDSRYLFEIRDKNGSLYGINNMSHGKHLYKPNIILYPKLFSKANESILITIR